MTRSAIIAGILTVVIGMWAGVWRPVSQAPARGGAPGSGGVAGNSPGKAPGNSPGKAPGAAWWAAQVPVTVVLTGGERGAIQGPDGRSGARAQSALMARLTQRARNARGTFVPIALGWHLQDEPGPTNARDAVYWRALFETSGYLGTLLGGPECSEPSMSQPITGAGEVGLPRRPLNVLLAARHLASQTSPFFDIRVDGGSIRALTVLDSEDAKRLQDRGEALGQIAVSTVFQNLPPQPDKLWIVATWPRAEATIPALAAAVGRLGPAIVVDVSGVAGRRDCEYVPVGGTNKPLVLALADPGVSVGVLDLVPDPATKTWRVSYRIVPVGPVPPSDAAARRADALLSLRAETLRLSGSLGRAPVKPDPGARYVGSTGCIACHTAIYKSWKDTPHAQAMRTLQSVHAAWDPSCVACHVVGWQTTDDGIGATRFASGFRDPASTGYLGGVGCESCHGPGSLHLMDPWNPALFQSPGPNRRAGLREDCATCHTSIHDPGFDHDFEHHVRAVGHGRVPSDRRTIVPERLLERLRKAGLGPR